MLRTKENLSRWKEFLGIFAKPELHNCIWVHAVSVGEIMAAMPIIQQLQTKLPNNDIVITCTTVAGSRIIQKRLPKTIFHVYCPFDINFAVNNFLSKINPKLLIILEKELWPNIILSCNKHNIPIVIANAQITNRSFSRYLWIKPLISYCLKKIHYICAQTNFDVYKFKKLIPILSLRDYKVVGEAMVVTVGNTKFDLATQNIESNSISPLRQTWIAASTHPGEEELVLQAHKEVLKQIPDALLILVPRHSERCSSLIKQITNFNVVLRSQQVAPTGEVYLVDSVGELNILYGMSNVAFVGGSLIPMIGGHNVLEPAALALPILVGPYTDNCKQIVSKLKMSDGLKIIKNPKELAEEVINLLSDQNLCKKIGANAKNFLFNQTGASDKIMELILSLICH